MAKSKKPKPKKSRASLSPLREQLQVLVDVANQKVDTLLNQRASSRALVEAQRTLKRQSSRVRDDVLFRSDLKTRKQINREFARVHAFLGDYTSSIEGSENFETDLTTLKGAFGGEWQATTGENFDTSRIDKDIAKKTFETYRKTVEAVGGWERAVGMFQGKESLIGYGSENLITNIYDMYLNMNQFSTDADKAEEMIMNRARELVQEGIDAYEEMSKRQVSGYDYGIMFDDETAQSRRAFYTWKHKFKNAQKG
ncbi:MAG: hypothetical protein J6S67_02350 [Methanobrevibacter sp.]|nr:hypothetical protein [Methanobrevibacter sp.]